MKIIVHPNTSFLDVQKICWKDMPLWRKALGSICTQVTTVNLDTNECHIYLTGTTPSHHEMEHCKGGDHDGALQAYFDVWKSHRE